MVLNPNKGCYEQQNHSSRQTHINTCSHANDMFPVLTMSVEFTSSTSSRTYANKTSPPSILCKPKRQTLLQHIRPYACSTEIYRGNSTKYRTLWRRHTSKVSHIKAFCASFTEKIFISEMIQSIGSFLTLEMLVMIKSLLTLVI